MGIGLALSGGGIRGAAHIGAIKALKENDIEIESISGTSAGAIVASLFAMGYTSNEIIKLFEYFAKDIMEISPKYLFNSMRRQKSIKLQGLASSIGIENAIKDTARLKGIKTISDIKIPIVIPSADLIQNKKIVFTNKNIGKDGYINDIEIGKAVRASATFPGMYEPFEYKEYQFVDGGIFDNLPVIELKKIVTDKILAIKFGVAKNKKEKTMYNISMKSLDIMQEGLMKDDMRKADCILSIDLRDVKVFNVDKVRFCYEQGYVQTKSKMEEIKQKLF